MLESREDFPAFSRGVGLNGLEGSFQSYEYNIRPHPAYVKARTIILTEPQLWQPLATTARITTEMLRVPALSLDPNHWVPKASGRLIYFPSGLLHSPWQLDDRSWLKGC